MIIDENGDFCKPNDDNDDSNDENNDEEQSVEEEIIEKQPEKQTISLPTSQDIQKAVENAQKSSKLETVSKLETTEDDFEEEIVWQGQTQLPQTSLPVIDMNMINNTVHQGPVDLFDRNDDVEENVDSL